MIMNYNKFETCWVEYNAVGCNYILYPMLENKTYILLTIV